MPLFEAKNESKCNVSWEYQLEFIESSTGLEPKYYFSYDTNTHAITLRSFTADMAKQAFTMRLVGVNTNNRRQVHKINFRISFVEAAH